VVTTWTALGEPQLLTVGFATTRLRLESIKANMAAARKKFTETITSQLDNIPPPADSRFAPNKAGNCPEFMIWELLVIKKVNTFSFVGTWKMT